MSAPLASRIRPTTLDGFVGQEHLLGNGKILRRIIENDDVSSMIFWGPPGVGKTTLAGIIADRTKADFVNFSAVTSGIKKIKAVSVCDRDLMQHNAKNPLVGNVNPFFVNIR